jgi:hypothetical protein
MLLESGEAGAERMAARIDDDGIGQNELNEPDTAAAALPA